MNPGSNTHTKRWIVMAVAVTVLFLVIALIILNKNSGEYKYTNSTVAMGTVVSTTLYGSESECETISADITQSVNSLDSDYLSWRIDGSDVESINSAAADTSDKSVTVEVSSFTADCIADCLEISEATDGDFDISVGKISTLWNIGTDDARLPSDSEIEDALKAVSYERISVSGNAVTLDKDQFIDLGAAGKGIACDSLYDIVSESKINAAVIAVGGSIMLYGSNPSSDDGKWTVGVRNPFGTENDVAMTLKLDSGFVSTSGDYEKVLEVDGVKYHHILDPKTGYPADSNVTGVTVIAPSGFLSDALSTACFIMGYCSETLELLEKYNSEAVFIFGDGTYTATDGIKSSISAVDDAFTEV